MLKKAALTVVGGAALLVVVACADTPTTPTPAMDLSPAFAIGPVGSSVAGQGSFDFGGSNRTFAFTARMLADGSVDGQWQRVTHTGGPAQSRSHGKITCFTIVGNQAWIGGFKTSGTTFVDPPNNEVRWRVADNGEGTSDPADQISAQFVAGGPGSAANYCASTPGHALNDLTAGNIQVRD